ncbi:MAG TPA: hypothetical protein VKI65_13975, partial [Gemmataceae bacterium]|nr:hypothetical protein [Gemmataceae bacterium]
QQGKQQPPDIYKAKPRQKILIDTVKPIVGITAAERQGEDIVVSWQIQEKNPDLATLKLEYRLADGQASSLWYAVPLNAATTGQTKFRMPSLAALQLRMEIKDLAGNIGTGEKEVAAAPAGGPSPHWDTQGSSGAPVVMPPVAPVTKTLPATGPSPTNGMAAPGSPWEQQPPVLNPTLVRPEFPPPPNRPVVPNATTTNYQQAGSPSGESGARLLASSRSGGEGFPPPANSNDSYAPRGPLPLLQLVNETRINLEYEVTRVGPSNIGSVELYLTKDEGRTWQKWADDPDLKPPITAELPGEGVYGFRLVIHSGAGLSKGTPQSGDLPEMRVEVDTTPPVVELYELRPDPSRPNTLILTWTAKDKNLAADPITLQWAERPDGSVWNSIAAGLANSGQYLWQLPPNMPPRVYLRVSARDTAGNTGVAETREPMLVDLNKPEGRLLRISGARDPQGPLGFRQPH